MDTTSPVQNRRDLSLREILLVLAILAAAGAIGYGAWQQFLAWKHQSEIAAAWPLMATEARRQRDQISAAIEAYHSHFGIYPPDHVVNRNPLRVDPVTNTLLYELAGTIFDSDKKTFSLPRVDLASGKALQETFQINSFTNSVTPGKARREFLVLDGFAFFGVHDDPDLVTLQLPMYVDGVSYDASPEFLGSSSWCYVTTGATNNPGRFDLWMVIRTETREVTVGNWPAVH